MEAGRTGKAEGWDEKCDSAPCSTDRCCILHTEEAAQVGSRKRKGACVKVGVQKLHG